MKNKSNTGKRDKFHDNKDKKATNKREKFHDNKAKEESKREKFSRERMDDNNRINRENKPSERKSDNKTREKTIFNKEKRELFIWGKRTVEGFLTRLHENEGIEVSKYKLHIIVDKAGKAPAQLKPIVESAKALGISLNAHSSAEPESGWPLGESSDLNHQRVCLKIPEYPISHMEDAISLIKEKVSNHEEHGCLGLVLDQIQDPRNFGAILRSAAFFGVKFIIYATDRQADITGLVLKTSAGGAFSLMLIPVVNINRALAQLKEAGAWTIGTMLQENSVEFKQLPKDRSWVLVFGNEEKGLRNEVAKNCDYLVKIPGGSDTVDSLNVSVAAGVCLHALQQ